MRSRKVQTAKLDATFAALADPTRRRVVEALFERPCRAGELAQRVALSPPALSRHLRTLRRAAIVVEEGIDSDARVRIYRIRQDGLAPLRGWLDRAEALWSDQLRSFKAYAEQTRRTRARRA
jgi:DNA-binding transcriptional ArsR family regulator